MKEEELYKYCPKCGAKALEAGKIAGLKCSNCDFDFFLNPKPASVGIIFDEEDRLLMTLRKINPYKGYWDLPSGFIKKGEIAEQALTRELKEELNIEIEIKSYFCSAYDKYPYKGTTLIALDFGFLCDYKGEILPNHEVSSYSFFSKSQLPRKITPHHKQFVDQLIRSGKLK